MSQIISRVTLFNIQVHYYVLRMSKNKQKNTVLSSHFMNVHPTVLVTSNCNILQTGYQIRPSYQVVLGTNFSVFMI